MNKSFLNKNKKSFWASLGYMTYIYIFLVVLIFLCIFFLNSFLKVRNINVTFFDESNENQEIKNYIEDYLKKEGNSFFNFVNLDEMLLTKLIHDEYQVVESVKISKKYNLDLNVVVSKNDEFFFTCMNEEDNFLVRCMLGNSEGSFFKEITDEIYAKDKNILKFTVNKEALFSNTTNESEKPEELDSLSGTRIYEKKDFLVLKEILNWLLKNGFEIKQVNVDELKIVKIDTNFYSLKISLDKGFVDTVKDFELISRTGKLQKYISEEKEKIDYIDLSFKNKVFWKLKGESNLENDMKNDIMSTTSTTTLQ